MCERIDRQFLPSMFPYRSHAAFDTAHCRIVPNSLPWSHALSSRFTLDQGLDGSGPVMEASLFGILFPLTDMTIEASIRTGNNGTASRWLAVPLYRVLLMSTGYNRYSMDNKNKAKPRLVELGTIAKQRQPQQQASRSCSMADPKRPPVFSVSTLDLILLARSPWAISQRNMHQSLPTRALPQHVVLANSVTALQFAICGKVKSIKEQHP
ncbi:hypothetical protein GGI42DRAFT_297598 [Trichoderma sp. SZMC 28013]